MNYYDEIIKKITQHIEKNPFHAMSLIEEELSMPYIEKEFYQQLQTLKSQAQSHLPPIQKQQDVHDLLFCDETIMAGLDYLRNANIRQYMDIVEKFLTSDVDEYYKGILIMILIDQNYYEEVKMTKENFDIQFHPNQIDLPFMNDTIIALHEKITQKLMQYPQYASACIDLMYETAIRNLPFSYEMSEINQLYSEIIEKVLTIYDEKTLMKRLLLE